MLEPAAAGIGSEQAILFATSREPEPPLFGPERSESLSFGRIVVSVPPDRSSGKVTWPSRAAADPRTDFLTTSAARAPDRATFVTAVDRELAVSRGREAIVFVHGYNTTFAEGLYRQAQMRHDFGLPDLSVYYSWPSAGALTGYVYDKESAIFGAEGLADLMELLAQTRVEQIALVGHSMGGFVTMEALRLLALRKSDRALAQIHAVVLLAPDEDVDLFRQRMRGLEDRAPPIYVFASERDRALRASARLQGRRTRLGALTDAGAIDDLPVYLLDISDVESADPYRHNNVATSPLMIALIRGLDREGILTFEDFQRGSGGIAELTVHNLQQATQVLVNPVRQ